MYGDTQTHGGRVTVTHCVHADQIDTHHADCVLNYPAASGLVSEHAALPSLHPRIKPTMHQTLQCCKPGSVCVSGVSVCV